MKRFAILLALAAPASAAETTWTTTQPGYSNCCADGSCWMEHGSLCHSNPTDRVPLSLGGNGIITGMGTSITNTPTPKCPDGYSLVLRSSGSPACARDIIDPQ